MHRNLKMVRSTLLSSVLAVTTTFSHLGVIYAEEIPNQSINITNEKNSTKEQSVIKGIKLNKNQFDIGENIEIVIDVDNTINDYNSFILNYYNEEGKQINLYSNINLQNGKYESNLFIEENFEESKWMLKSIVGINNSTSTEYIDISSLDIKQANFEIVKKEDIKDYSIKKNSTKVLEKPTIESISVDKKNAKHGDKVNVELKFKEGYLEDIYEISSTYFIELENGTYGYGVYFEYNFDKELYEASFDINDGMLPGEYNIGAIQIRENYYDEPIYITSDDYDFSQYSINLDTLGDREEPTLELVTIDKKEAILGDEIKFYIKANDNLSVVNRGQVTLIDGNNNEHYVYLTYNEDSKQLEGSFYITNRIPSGKLSINNVWLQDHSGNSSSFGSGIYSEPYDFSDHYINISGTVGDAQGPKIHSIYVDKNEAKPGDTVKIEVEAEDESEMSYGLISFKDESEQYFSAYLGFNSESGKYEGELNITHGMINGVLSISSIDVYDIHGNYTYMTSYDNDFSKYDILVSDSIGDGQGPELNSISVDKNYATLGDKVTFSVDATDKLSEVSSVEIEVEIKYPQIEQSRYRSIYARYNDSTQKWEATLDITNDIPEGIIKVKYVRLIDTYGNQNYYHDTDYNFTSCNIEVSGTLGDIKGPELVSIDVDKKEAGHGDSIKITVDAKDDKTKVSSVRVEYKSKKIDEYGYSDYEYVYCEYNTDTNKWEGIINVNNRMKNGVWEVEYVSLVDECGNYTSIWSDDYDFSNVDITLNTLEDSKAPELKSISVDKNNINKEGRVKISADIQDVSGVEWASITYKNISSDDYYDTETTSFVYNSDTNLYEGYIYFNDWMNSGIYSIESIYLVDSLGNRVTIYNDDYDFSNCNIELTGTVGRDNNGPEIKSVELDKYSATKNEEIKVSIDVTDDKSGVKTVGARFINLANEEYKVVNCKYNATTLKYEANIDITDEDTSGKWKLEYVYAEDNRWNSSWRDDIDVSIDIYGTIGKDDKAPILENISVDNNTIKLKVSDDKSGVNKVDVRYYNKELNKYTWVNCNYNSNTGMFEGYLNINSNMSGEWKITSVYLQDNSYNWDYVYSDEYDFSKYNITIASLLDEAIVEELQQSDKVEQIIEEIAQLDESEIVIEEVQTEEDEQVLEEVMIDELTEEKSINNIGEMNYE